MDFNFLQKKTERDLEVEKVDDRCVARKLEGLAPGVLERNEAHSHKKHG